MSNFRNITMALAGVFQATQQVVNVTTHGNTEQRIIEPLIGSILKLNANSCLDVYGSIANIKPGLRLIESQLSIGSSEKSVAIGRYIAGLLNIERHLNRSAEMQATLATRLTQIKRLTDDTTLMDKQIIHSIAQLYSETISTLPLRIQVVGNKSMLEQTDIQDQIRCCLFCGLRSAVLWRQMGGKRRQLILNRKQIISSANDLLLGR